METVLGGFSIEQSLVTLLREKLQPGSALIEFGSGEGTTELLKYFSVLSIEHNKDFIIQRAGHHKIVHAPLEEGWYCTETVRKIFRENNAKCLLVDGPPAPFRANLLQNIHVLDGYKGAICFDDINRNEDYILFDQFCSTRGYTGEILKGEQKYFGYCTPVDG